jgi:phosphatidyl-myo-inositol dimannoside synthase
MLHTVEQMAEREGAELIQLGHPLPAGLLGPRLRQRHGIPYVVFLGGAEVTLPGVVPGVNNALRHVLGNAAMLLTVSEYTAAAARKQTGGAVPAEVLRPPLNVAAFVPAEGDEAARLRERLGIDGELVVCVGRLVPRKGQDKLIDALCLLRQEFPRLHLVIIGEGRLATGLYDRAQKRGVGERVHLTGALADTTMKEWLRAADLFASPCRSRWGGLEVEGFGIVFAEAALAGLPVLAGASGGAPEAVVQGDTGLVVDGHSVQQVAAALASILRRTPEQRRTMGAKRRELALSRHTPAVVGERYRELLRRAAAT